MSEDFWSLLTRYDADQSIDLLDAALALPDIDPTLALMKRAMFRFRAGDYASALDDAGRVIDLVERSPVGRWVRQDSAMITAFCRFALGLDGIDAALALVPRDHPAFDEKQFETSPGYLALQERARPDAPTVVERYLATRARLARNAIDRAALFETIGADEVILQIGAMDGVRFDPLCPIIQKHRSPGILVEPVRDMFDLLVANYGGYERLTLANVAIAEVSGPQTIYRVPASQVASGAAEEWALAVSSLRKPHLESTLSEMYIEEVIDGLTFADFAERYGLRAFDVLQIDTESYDWRILKQIDLSAYGCRIVNVEHRHINLDDRLLMVEHLDRHGFTASCNQNDLWGVRR